MANTSTTTGGGPYVGGNAETTGGDFIGRDYNQKYVKDVSGGVIINFDDPSPMGAPIISNATLLALITQVERLIIRIDGSTDYGAVGLTSEIKNLHYAQRYTLGIALFGLVLGAVALWIR